MFATTQALKYLAGDSYINRASLRVIISSSLDLTVDIEGKKHVIWMASEFRRALGIVNLTKKRRERIIATLPASVEVEKKVSAFGTVYYRLTEECLQSWAKATGIK